MGGLVWPLLNQLVKIILDFLLGSAHSPYLFSIGGVRMNSPSGQVLTWHEDCLQCCKCQAALNTENVVFNEKLFCKSCYVDTMLNKCDACVKPITGVGFTFRGRFWHDTCFACDICQTVFDEGKFRNLREQKFCDTCFKNSTRAV